MFTAVNATELCYFKIFPVIQRVDNTIQCVNEGLSLVFGNKGTRQKYCREQGNMNLFKGTRLLLTLN